MTRPDGGAFDHLAPMVWRLQNVEFDEGRFELWVDSQPVRVEPVPLKVLQRLLHADGEPVFADDLLASIWHRDRETISRNAVSNAVAKLRRAIGDEAQALIVATPRRGYRLTARPERVRPAAAPALAGWLAVDKPVPHTTGWVMDEAIKEAPLSAVWRAHHPDGRRAVFKFALHADTHLRDLRREVSISSALLAALGPRPEFVRPIETNLHHTPYFVATADAGVDMLHWAQARGGLAAIALQQRLDIMAAVAAAMAAAHSVGVLHKDLKPDNVLIVADDEARPPVPQVQIIDFGSGQLLNVPISQDDRNSLMTAVASNSEKRTLMYLSPERLVGQPATAASDLYACGVMLYQLVVGDFERPISPSWEEEVADPLLREDIALATHRDPSRRLDSLFEMARRLHALSQRRTEAEQRQNSVRQAQVAQQALARARARRPWMLSAGALFLVGMIASIHFAYEARVQRDEARSQQLRAQSINDFLVVGFLQTANPALGGDARITLRDAMRSAGRRLDTELKEMPVDEATLHQVIGNNFLALLELRDAVQHLRRAVDISQATPAAGADALFSARCDLGGALTVAGDFAAAKPLADVARVALERDPASLRPATQCKCRQLLGRMATARGDKAEAVRQFKLMADLADENPSATQRQRGLARAVYGQALLEDGRAAEGLATLVRVADSFATQFGRDQFDALSASYMVAQAQASLGAVEQARSTFVRVGAAYSRLFGADSPLVQQVQRDLTALPERASDGGAPVQASM